MWPRARVPVHGEPTLTPRTRPRAPASRGARRPCRSLGRTRDVACEAHAPPARVAEPRGRVGTPSRPDRAGRPFCGAVRFIVYRDLRVRSLTPFSAIQAVALSVLAPPTLTLSTLHRPPGSTLNTQSASPAVDTERNRSSENSAAPGTSVGESYGRPTTMSPARCRPIPGMACNSFIVASFASSG